MDNNKKLFEELLKADSINPAGATESERTAFGKMLNEQSKPKQAKPSIARPDIWRLIMKSRITKFAAAAVLVAVVLLSITFLDKSVTSIYAIEQTIEANRAIHYLHFKYFYKSHDDVAKEFWLKFDENGKLKNARINFSKYVGAGQVVVWGESETQRVWNRKQNTLTFLEDELYTAKVLKFVREYDPKQAVESLYNHQANNMVKIEIEEPSNETDPIVITATYLPNTFYLEGASPEMRQVLFVDQVTKLVTTMEIYELKDEEYEYMGVYEYQDYDQPFDAKFFSLEDEVPADAMRIYERTNGDIGLAQGDLTDKEIAIKVTREFFEALIVEDYAKAGRLLGGMSTAEVEETFGNLNVLRIISIGEPVWQKKPSCLRVPCTIEIEKDSEIVEWQPQGPFVRKVYRHPRHWRIIGGLDK